MRRTTTAIAWNYVLERGANEWNREAESSSTWECICLIRPCCCSARLRPSWPTFVWSAMEQWWMMLLTWCFTIPERAHCCAPAWLLLLQICVTSFVASKEHLLNMALIRKRKHSSVAKFPVTTPGAERHRKSGALSTRQKKIL